MSVLIKGMEMPTEPTPVTLYPDGHWNNYLDGSIGKFSHLPEKHGRLGDLDETEALLRAYADDVGPRRGEYALANGILKAVSRLRDVSTIIEAEGG